MSSARLATNLVGRKVHLLTDEEARDAARRQGDLDDVLVSRITAATWFPAIVDYRKRLGATTVGEIVAVHLNKDNELEYTLSFNGEFVKLWPDIFRLEPKEATD